MSVENPFKKIEKVLNSGVLNGTSLQVEITNLLSSFKELEKKNKKLGNGVNEFLDKNYKGGAKSDREDYVTMVSCKDIWDLRELVKTI